MLRVALNKARVVDRRLATIMLISGTTLIGGSSTRAMEIRSGARAAGISFVVGIRRVVLRFPRSYASPAMARTSWTGVRFGVMGCEGTWWFAW